MRGVVWLLIIVVVFIGFCYILLPEIIAGQIAQRLQGALGLTSEPDVEVVSDFPPELLLGRIDGIRVNTDAATLQGIGLGGVQVDLSDVEVSIPGLVQGEPAITAGGCSMTAETPPLTIDDDQECLLLLGLGG